ncbi:hypothetical protein [Aeromonas hydrophila]|uniref:hypothetical protein n=1 Tax=Aeromonas hydrophila TaxID=644 RepID=UPI000B002433|nr:hypothetical protein [Aeromonas hydrophila]
MTSLSQPARSGVSVAGILPLWGVYSSESRPSGQDSRPDGYGFLSGDFVELIKSVKYSDLKRYIVEFSGD